MTINYKGDAIRAITTLGLAGVDITEWPVSETEVAAIKSNIGYNTALSAGLFALGQLNLVDGVVNPFSAETEVDLPASSGQVYDATGDFYKNDGIESFAESLSLDASGWGGHTIRTIVPASSISTSGARVRVTFKAASDRNFKVDNVAIVERSGSTADGTGAPVELLFGASSGFNITAGQTITSDWLTFSVDNTKDYLVIMDFSDSGGDGMAKTNSGPSGGGRYFKSGTNSYNTQTLSSPSGGESSTLEGVQSIDVGYANITLQSTAVTASAVSTEAHLSFLLTPMVALTPDTDIKGYVSRDGGTTWTQVALVSQSIGFPWQVMMSGGVDLSSQPSGTSMKWRLISANNKEFQFENVSLFWN